MIQTAERPMSMGLTEREARARRAAGQGNHAPPPTGRTYLQIVRENVVTFINTILFLLGLALVLVGRPLDALVSVGVIALNVVVSVVQEVRAKRTLDRIALLTRPRVTVFREGQTRAVAPEELVLGDVLIVGPGDQIVLDGHLLEGHMQVDESQLTGESDSILKQAGDAVYSGSFCISGGGRYLAEAVGQASLANQITAGARSFRRVLTPLQQHIHLVIRIVLALVLYLQLLLAAHAMMTLLPLGEAIGQATVLAGLVPNGLFLSIALAYALGAVRIIRFGALVQQSNAIESLSHVDVLCLDKTGTLTANRLQVSALRPLRPAMTEADLRHILGTVAISAPTSNKTSDTIAQAFPATPQRLVAEVPFTSARKWSALALDDSDPIGTLDDPGRDEARGGGRPLRGLYALGAPEFLQPYLSVTPGAEAADWPRIDAQTREWAARGLRVLLLAHHPDPALLEDRGDDTRLPDGMRALGLIGLSDELRPEAGATLAAFVAAGVTPKIISGDDPQTVAALARQAGLDSDSRLVSGLELERMDANAFGQAVHDVTIFGRITPQQKVRLVAALHAQGHYVAMIGDGVNDVLALKQADLAIALQGGTQAARAVADIVLVNDSFAALVPAVREGQRILGGMQHILKLFLARISTIGLVILSAAVIGLFPLALRNGSVITFLTVGVPSVLLAVWARPTPRPSRGLAHDLLSFVIPVAVLSSLLGLVVFYGTLALHLWEHGIIDSPRIALLRQDIASSVPLAQTALTTFLVYCGLLLVLFVAPPTAWWTGRAEPSPDKRPAVMALVLMGAFVVIVLVPPLRQLFALTQLELPTCLLIAVALLVWLVLLRLVWRRRAVERLLGDHDVT